VEAFDTSVNLYGQFAFLLWRSVYITKQVRLAQCLHSTILRAAEHLFRSFAQQAGLCCTLLGVSAGRMAVLACISRHALLTLMCDVLNNNT
jgi:hypothetical protein